MLMTDLFPLEPCAGGLRMTRLLWIALAPFVFFVRCARWVKNPTPFIVRREEKIYAISHYGRSFSQIRSWFDAYCVNALVCPTCHRIFLPGEKVSRRGKDGIVHHDTFCVEEPDYIGIISKDGRVQYAYPEGKSLEEMARHARIRKAHDM